MFEASNVYNNLLKSHLNKKGDKVVKQNTEDYTSFDDLTYNELQKWFKDANILYQGKDINVLAIDYKEYFSYLKISHIKQLQIFYRYKACSVIVGST